MTTIRLTQPGTGKVVNLDQAKIDLFMAELQRTARAQSDPTKAPRGIAQDCLISVRSGTTRRELALYGRTVLRDLGTQRERQFYMGLLVLEWLQ